MTRSIVAALVLCIAAGPGWATQDGPVAPLGKQPVVAKATAVAAAQAGARATGGKATGGAATAAGGNANGSVTVNAAPGFGLPSFGGGVCGIVGMGGAGSGAVGVALGPAWESTNCHRRELAKILLAMGRVAEAEALLMQDDAVAEAYKAVAERKAPPAVQQVATAPRPSWCNVRGAPGEVHPDCR